MLDRRFQASGIKRVRVLVPFDDVVHGGHRLAALDHWFNTAQAQGIEPLVSFYRSYRIAAPPALGGRAIAPTSAASASATRG